MKEDCISLLTHNLEHGRHLARLYRFRCHRHTYPPTGNTTGHDNHKTRVYLNDNNAAAHSVDSDIFYAVIPLHILYASMVRYDKCSISVAHENKGQNINF